MDNDPEDLSPPIPTLLQHTKAEIKTLLEHLQAQEEPDRETVRILMRKEAVVKCLEQKGQSAIEQTNKLQNRQFSEQEVNARIEELNSLDDNDSNWTDATQSIADSQNDVWIVDDEIIQAMDESDEQEQEEEQQQGQEQKVEGEERQQEESDKRNKNKGKLDLQELQSQFVKGGQSDEFLRLGQHQKFCTAVGASGDGKVWVSGGGDDRLLFYRNWEDGEKSSIFQVAHTETVSKVDISHDGKYVISMSEKEVFCTNLDNFEFAKVQVQDPTDIVCHHQGGVFAVSHDFNVSIFNIKGLKVFESYTLDRQPTIIAFSDTGKQIVAVCDDKLRIITPKTGEVVKVTGPSFHTTEISSMATSGQLTVTGCLDGKLFCSSLAKGGVLAAAQPLKGAINSLCIAEGYFLAAPHDDGLHWFDLARMKRLFHNQTQGSVTALSHAHSNIYVAADFSGQISIFDRRNPMKPMATAQAGNTVHALSVRESIVGAACEDGFLRLYDLKKLLGN